MPWAAAAAVAGAVISSQGAQDAADTQAESAHEANVLNRDVYNNQVALNDPYRRMGLGAGNRLMTLLGLSPGATSPALGGTAGGTTGGASTTPQTREQLRSQLLSQFTTGGAAATQGGGAGAGTFGGTENGDWSGTGQPGGPQTIDEAGLNAEIDRVMAQQASQQGAGAGMGDPNDPEFGSAMRDFSMQDFQADPGYAFRVSEGEKALDRSAAARGGLLSGRAMKDLTRFGQDQGAQEYGAAFNRFQVSRSNKLNPLQSLLGVGQTATGALTGAAGAYGANTGNNIIGAGNANASGIVGGANAINSGIGQGLSSYQNNQLMNRLFPGGGSTAGGTGTESWRTTGNGMPTGYLD